MLAATAALAAVALLPACYTLLQHPRLAGLDYSRPSSKRCLSCHNEQELRRFIVGPQEAKVRSAWSAYYDDPWWFGGYLRSDSTTSENGKPLGTTSNQKEHR